MNDNEEGLQTNLPDIFETDAFTIRRLQREFEAGSIQIDALTNGDLATLVEAIVLTLDLTDRLTDLLAETCVRLRT